MQSVKRKIKSEASDLFEPYNYGEPVGKKARLLVKKSNNPGIPKSMSRLLGRPAFLLFSSSLGSNYQSQKPNLKTILQFQHLIAKVDNILKTGTQKPYNKEMCSLEKISMGFEELCGRKNDLKCITNFTRDLRLSFFEQEFLTAAKWFGHFDEFRNLPVGIQLDIVKTSWMVFGRLNGLIRTAEFRRNQDFPSDQVFLVSAETYVDSKTTEIDVSWYTDHKREEVESFMSCFNNPNFDLVIRELIALRPTNTELNFMLMNLCLQQAEKKLPGSYAEIIDYLQSVLANQIHKHYTKQWKMPNYSGRLAKMMKINNLMKKDTWEMSEKMRLADLFDIFTLEFSNKELLW